MIRRIRNFLAAATIAAAPITTMLMPGIAHAATYTCTWTGATSSAFALAGNWSGCNSDFPQTADTNDLVFPVSATNKTITVPAGYTFSSVTFNGTGSGAYAISGSPFTISGNVTDSSDQDNSIGNNVTFTGAPSTISVSGTQDVLTFGGTVSGSTSLVKTGANVVAFTGAFGFTGSVTVNAGQWTMRATSAADATFSSVSLASGATFNYNPFDYSSVTTYTFSKDITSAGGIINFNSTAPASGGVLNLTGTITLSADSEIEVGSGVTAHIQGPLHGPGFVLSASAGSGGSILNESSDNTTDTPDGDLVAGSATDSDDGGLESPDTGFALATANPGVTIAITLAAAGALFAAARMSRKSTSRR